MAHRAASAAASAAGPCHVSSCWQSISSSPGVSSSLGHAALATCLSLVLLVLVFFLSQAFIELLVVRLTASEPESATVAARKRVAERPCHQTSKSRPGSQT